MKDQDFLFATKKAQALIALGVCLDHVQKMPYDGCTFVESVHIQIKKETEEPLSAERGQKKIVFFRQLLEVVKTAAMARKQLIRDSIGDAISHGPKELVLEYYEAEKFAQTKDGIDSIYKRLKTKWDAEREVDRNWHIGPGNPFLLDW